MEFKVGERLALMGILPKEGNLLTARVVRELRQSLEFSEIEMAQYALKIDGSRFTWDAAKDSPKEIAIGDAAKDVVIKALKDLDKSGKVLDQHLILFDKFQVTGA